MDDLAYYIRKKKESYTPNNRETRHFFNGCIHATEMLLILHFDYTDDLLADFHDKQRKNAKITK